ncbi:substrate-binding periplasmic protein [Vibrio brasiliensis]|uniref:Amino acid ABC transporter periplasmic protein n=1 Tax=Vibrio brasiliensis LMG 20546 TaxID=945543 RepID=E8LZZ0_9VIBR|nr:transporter substrate-binding domain-containing protein [Vibrio brasiliensis]EGA63737.1 amino acid ABC transporter periplasmic protein [Vibrio brasiliensis LMG 20546]
MNRVINAALLTLLIWYGGTSHASEYERVKIVSHEWKGYTDAYGTGLYWDIIREAFDTQGINIYVEVMPWKRAKHAVEHNAANAYVGDYYHPQHDGRQFLYPRWHLSIEEDVVVVLSHSDLMNWQQQGLNSLANRKVAWVRDYGFEHQLLQNIPVNMKEVDDVYSAIELIKKGRVNALLDYRSALTGSDLLSSSQYSIRTAKAGEKLYVVFSNSLESQRLIDTFDLGMEELVNSGRLENIYQKYQLDYQPYYNSVIKQGLLTN